MASKVLQCSLKEWLGRVAKWSIRHSMAEITGERSGWCSWLLGDQIGSGTWSGNECSHMGLGWVELWVVWEQPWTESGILLGMKLTMIATDRRRSLHGLTGGVGGASTSSPSLLLIRGYLPGKIVHGGKPMLGGISSSTSSIPNSPYDLDPG